MQNKHATTTPMKINARFEECLLFSTLLVLVVVVVLELNLPFIMMIRGSVQNYEDNDTMKLYLDSL